MKRMIFRLPEGEYQNYKAYYESMGLFTELVYLVLGEVENMPGHVAVVTADGRVKWGLHEELFVKDPDEDRFIAQVDNEVISRAN